MTARGGAGLPGLGDWPLCYGQPRSYWAVLERRLLPSATGVRVGGRDAPFSNGPRGLRDWHFDGSQWCACCRTESAASTTGVWWQSLVGAVARQGDLRFSNGPRGPRDWHSMAANSAAVAERAAAGASANHPREFSAIGYIQYRRVTPRMRRSRACRVACDFSLTALMVIRLPAEHSTITMLVVSNKTAWLLRHTVQVKADLRCRRQWFGATLGE